MNAEAYQPWNTIGFDQWIGAGKWWLFRAQSHLHTIAEAEQTVAPAAYADLIKAAWILADVIPGHPQFPFISACKSSELQSLSAEVKNEYSRITALAMVVPALDELSSQDLKLWESIPTKAPILRPYKVSQNLNAWRVDGGEHVLFRRFAFHGLDSVTGSPCIVLFLVHESAKAARLIAQDQYGDIVKAISFQEYVECRRDGESVTAGQENFILGHSQEAQVLFTMIETTNFYLLGRQADHASLEDLRAYILLTTVKNRQWQAVLQILQEFRKTNNIVESNQKGSLGRLAVSIASQWIERRLLPDDGSQYCWSPETSSFRWAVICNYTTLTEFLVSEDPVIDMTSNPWHPLEEAAKHGNEPVVRWCFNHPSARDFVSPALNTAVYNGHANLVALFVDLGADINHGFYDITHKALRSALSPLVIHAILAIAYATKSEFEFSLRKAVDRGHEGAIVLLSYAETLKRRASPVYSSNLTHDSGNFAQVVAVFARVPNMVPAFNLTLMTVERQRTQVLEVRGLCPSVVINIYLDSYHAYIEDVPEGVSETYKKAVEIGTSGEFSFTVVHQEESLKFTGEQREFLGNDGPSDFRIGRYSKGIELDGFNDVRVEFPIINWPFLQKDQAASCLTAQSAVTSKYSTTRSILRFSSSTGPKIK